MYLLDPDGVVTSGIARPSDGISCPLILQRGYWGTGVSRCAVATGRETGRVTAGGSRHPQGAFGPAPSSLPLAASGANRPDLERAAEILDF